ncbi:MAG TPA: hypothetical protein GX392_06190 [Clostridiales bacterium]|nr:hypothetical protein [Clostridiales bacterium]
MKNYVDYHISLIGTNPLPAFITLLKNSNKDTNIYLVHTKASRTNIGSEKVAKNLKEVVEERIPGANISLIPCDKSDAKDINQCINRLLKDIKKSMEKNKTYTLLLDYSSGTKAMSALFAERIFNANIEGLITIISYVDDNQKRILEDSKFVGKDRAPEIKNVVNNLDLSIEDITRIHGYRLEKELEEKIYKENIKYLESENQIVFINKNGSRTCVDEVYLLNGRLLLCFESKYLKKDEGSGVLKMELFEIKDKADKLGGSRSGIIYKYNSNKCKEETLRKDVKSAYEFEMEDRLEFISADSSFKERIEDIYIDEGGI